MVAGFDIHTMAVDNFTKLSTENENANFAEHLTNVNQTCNNHSTD